MIVRVTWHHDAAHGWFAVPFALVVELDIAHDISPYSYHDACQSIVYLEEDDDAHLFFDAANARGIDVVSDNQEWPALAPIRNLPRFVARMG